MKEDDDFAIFEDPERLNKQWGGTKDFIMDYNANLLVFIASRTALHPRMSPSRDLDKIRKDLECYDDADRYYDEKCRISTHRGFKERTLPFVIQSIRNTKSHLKSELWMPVLKLFFEKASDYIKLDD